MCKKNILTRFGLTAVLMATALTAIYSQQPARTDEVRVVAPFKPAVMDATKISENPKTEDAAIAKPEFNYEIRHRITDIHFELEPIIPARMHGEPLQRLLNGYIKGGIGTYSTPYLELFYNSLRSDTYNMGLQLRHLSSSGIIDGYGYSGFSDNLAKLHGKRFIGNHTLEAGLHYERNLLHRYGFQPNIIEQNPVLAPILENITREDLLQIFNQFNAHAALGSHHGDSSKFIYQTRIEYHYLEALKKATEQNIRLSGMIGRNINFSNRYVTNTFLKLEADVDYFAAQSEVDTSNTAVVKINPSAIFTIGRNFYLEAGLAIMAQSDTASYGRLFPHLSFNAHLIENLLIIHGGISGGISRHSLRSLVAQNPFINTSTHLGFLTNRMEISGGIKAAFSDNVSLNFSASHAMLDNFAFFVSDTTAPFQNTFVTTFDNIIRLMVRGELITQFGRDFQAIISAALFDYNLTNQLKPWHLPTSELTFSARYNIRDRVIFTADVFGRSATYARTFNPQGNQVVPVQLQNMHIDLNLGVEYRLNPLLSLFANFSNLGNQRLERWKNYPTQGFRFMAGATLAF